MSWISIATTLACIVAMWGAGGATIAPPISTAKWRTLNLNQQTKSSATLGSSSECALLAWTLASFAAQQTEIAGTCAMHLNAKGRCTRAVRAHLTPPA